jgi:uncharacterized Zn finger protein
MPQKLDPNGIVNLPCPKCGEKTEQTIAELETSPRLRCRRCGVQFGVDARKILQKIKEAEAKLGR